MALDLDVRLQRLERLVAMTLLSSGSSLPVTSVATEFSGDLIGTQDRYIDLYRNKYDRLIAIKVVGEFVVPGAAIDLSYGTTDSDKIDTLSSTGKVVSDTIWLKPNQSIYINTANIVFSCTGSVFRVLLFDPISFL